MRTTEPVGVPLEAVTETVTFRVCAVVMVLLAAETVTVGVILVWLFPLPVALPPPHPETANAVRTRKQKLPTNRLIQGPFEGVGAFLPRKTG